MKRRGFLNTTALTGPDCLILPSGVLGRAKNSPSNKLNIALIGVWGRGLAHYDSIGQRKRRRALRRQRGALSRMRSSVSPGQDLRRTGGSASSKRTSTPWSSAPPTTTTPSSPTGR